MTKMVSRKSFIFVLILAAIFIGTFAVIKFFPHFQALESTLYSFSFWKGIISDERRIGGERGETCSDDFPPRDIPWALVEKSKKPADAVLEELPDAVDELGELTKEDVENENGEFAKAVHAFSENVWESEQEAKDYFEQYVKPLIEGRGSLFRNQSAGLIGSFLERAGSASTGIFGYEFHHQPYFKGPIASKDLFSYRKKRLNLNAQIDLRTVTYEGRKYELEDAQFIFGGEYILDAWKNGNKLSVVSSIYFHC